MAWEPSHPRATCGNERNDLFKWDKPGPTAFQGTSAATTPDNQHYVLAGLVEGSCALFEVKVPKKESVHQLKKSVWEEGLKNTELHNINISRLTIVKVSIVTGASERNNLPCHTLNIAINAHDDKSLTQLKSEVNVEGERLMPLNPIAQYWSVQPPRGYLHILVRVKAPLVPGE